MKNGRRTSEIQADARTANSYLIVLHLGLTGSGPGLGVKLLARGS